MTNHIVQGAEGVADALPLNMPLSELLKQETAEIHSIIEHGSEVNRRIVERIDTSDEGAVKQYQETYRLFLLAAYGFERGVLDQLAVFAAKQDLTGFNYPEEERVSSELILSDLRELNQGEPSYELPVTPWLEPAESLADFAGMEYVRRGSRNGNAFIARIVQHNLGCGAESGAAFLNLDNGQVHPHWQQFKSWLDSLSLTEAEMLQAAASAMTTFRAVGEWHHQFEL